MFSLFWCVSIGHRGYLFYLSPPSLSSPFLYYLLNMFTMLSNIHNRQVIGCCDRNLDFFGASCVPNYLSVNCNLLDTSNVISGSMLSETNAILENQAIVWIRCPCLTSLESLLARALLAQSIVIPYLRCVIGRFTTINRHSWLVSKLTRHPSQKE